MLFIIEMMVLVFKFVEIVVFCSSLLSYCGMSQQEKNPIKKKPMSGNPFLDNGDQESALRLGLHSKMVYTRNEFLNFENYQG